MMNERTVKSASGRATGARDAAANAYVVREVEQHSAATLRAQEIVFRVREGEDPSIAWDELLTIIDRTGLQSIVVSRLPVMSSVALSPARLGAGSLPRFEVAS